MGAWRLTASHPSWLNSSFTLWAASSCCCQCSSTGLLLGEFSCPRLADTSCSVSLWIVTNMNNMLLWHSIALKVHLDVSNAL